MAATVITATTSGATSSSGAVAADTLILSATGVFGDKAQAASGDGSVFKVQISDDGTNWADAILGAPNGTMRVRHPGAYQFMLRAGWQWRLFVYDAVSTTSIRVAVE